ncbi:MAG: protein kinase [Trichodesmium sp. ALOHA_ZT_67]|nr:protein kinase [Trichodesmium sp. ALOHA_ZT_67]MDE5093763.1 protein kinase [Trichodesmium sp. St11_bin5]
MFLKKGQYEIIKTLTAGSFGQTYIAINKHSQPPNQEVVIKKLKPQQNDPYTLQNAERLFKKEVESLKKLGYHKQIPTYIDNFEENNEFYLVQEYIKGKDLTEELKPGNKLSESEVIHLLIDILEVLDFVHKNGVIHRDIKPSNLMRRTEDNQIVLIDFGAVKEVGTVLVNQQGQKTITVIIGTPGYMAGEQGQGHPECASDVYAVGKIAIQALMGVSPNLLAPNLLLRNQNNPELLWRQGVLISQELGNIIDKMVEQNCLLRYHNAGEALQEIKGILPADVEKYAGFWMRLAADLIDKTIIIIGSIIVDFIINDVTVDEAEFMARILVFYIIAGFIYCPVMDSSKTQGTFGKMLMGIKVTDLQRRRISFDKATKRHSSKFFSYLTLGIGFILASFNKIKRVLHDIIYGCLVIKNI